MTSPIDRIRRAMRLRGAGPAERRRADAGAFEGVAEHSPIAPTLPAPPVAGAAAFDAQLMGQSGEKRGLRAGKPALDSASSNYNRVEWSGSKDRRARKGKIADTEI